MKMGHIDNLVIALHLTMFCYFSFAVRYAFTSYCLVMVSFNVHIVVIVEHSTYEQGSWLILLIYVSDLVALLKFESR